MALPKVKLAVFEMRSITDTKNSIDDRYIETLAIIKEQNPSLFQYLEGAASHVLENPDDGILIEMYMRGAVAMYSLLNSQAEADDLQAQWGD